MKTLYYGKNWRIMACPCGHLHFVPCNIIDAAIHAEKEVFIVCTNCGNTIIVGGDKMRDPFDGFSVVYEMYTKRINGIDTIISGQNMKKIGSIYASDGFSIYLQDHTEANVFGDNCNEFYRVADSDLEETGYNIESVDLAKTIHQFRDQGMIDELKKCNLPQFDWSKYKETIEENVSLYAKEKEEAEKLSNKTLTSIDNIITHQSDSTKKQ